MTTWLGWLLGDFGHRSPAPKMDAASMELAREFTRRIRERNQRKYGASADLLPSPEDRDMSPEIRDMSAGSGDRSSSME
jgi:hypothetical protein